MQKGETACGINTMPLSISGESGRACGGGVRGSCHSINFTFQREHVTGYTGIKSFRVAV